MKTVFKAFLTPRTPLVILGGLLLCAGVALAQGTAFTYQGRFTDSGGPFTGTAEFQFTLWDAASSGVQVATATPASAFVSVSNGLFTVPIDFGGAQFTGADRWIQIDARTTLGPFTTLQPRQKVTSTPYAIRAGNFSGTLGSNQLAGIYGNALSLSNAGNVFVGTFTGSGAGLSNVSAATLGGLNAGAFWQLNGNAGTTAGLNFLGTTDNQPLEFKAGGQRFLRLEPATVSKGLFIFSNAPNFIAGSPVNGLGLQVAGATIGGGGTAGVYGDTGSGFTFFGAFSNHVSSDFGTIGGGLNHRIETNALGSTIGGGSGNIIQDGAEFATIGGGSGNLIGTNAVSATIAGGANTIQRDAARSTIGGGTANRILAGAEWATIPGGSGNIAAGSYSFAAGRAAEAFGQGTFVWADSTPSPFRSSGANQFLIRASGGVGIGTGSPQGLVDVHSGESDTSALFVRADPGTLGRGGVLHHQSSTYAWQELAQFTGSPTDGFLAFHYVNRTAPGTKVAANVLLLRGNGSVGIGTVPLFQLHLSADSAAKPNGGSWANSSDARVKKNIQPLSSALDKLTQLRGVSFEWVNPCDHANQAGRQAGFIAQEVERVFPDWVQEVPGAERDAKLTPDGKVKSLSLPFEFDALLVEALRELRAENRELKRELQQFKEIVSERDSATLLSELSAKDSEIQDLKDRLATVEKFLTNLKGTETKP